MQECMYISVYVGPMLVCMHVAYVCVWLANNFINRRVTSYYLLVSPFWRQNPFRVNLKQTFWCLSSVLISIGDTISRFKVIL